MEAATSAFLSRIGLAPGWASLDVGCGDGQVTIAMARVAGPRGQTVGVDSDAGALAIARDAAIRAGARAEFVRADVSRPTQTEAFDLVYARLVLSHLVDPAAAVRAMRAEARRGGVVAVEDLNLGTLRSEPPTPALDDLQDVYGATVRFHGGDPTIGPRLRALLSASGLEDVSQETVENPMDTADEKLFLADLVRNMRPAILAAGAATASELDALQARVQDAARDPGTVFYQARIYQVWGRRAALGGERASKRWRGPNRQSPDSGYEQDQPAAWREQDGEEPADRDTRQSGAQDKTGTDRQRERSYAPLVPPGRCPLYVRNHCYASTRGDTPIHGVTRRNGPPGRVSAASGPFSQVVAGVGFEPT
jgi:ubiquinone/menaquinone biosynthesis C-methylase UbiE